MTTYQVRDIKKCGTNDFDLLNQRANELQKLSYK